MKQLFYLLIFIPTLLMAQEKGVHFETQLSWEQVKEKAMQEHKYIFMDVYATWCVPCKKMDNEVYSLETVGTYLNAHFVSVKVQLDSSKMDDLTIQNWYSDAHNLISKYKVTEFPTFLFFTPGGEIVHRSAGALTETAFLKLASNATDPDKQDYAILGKYQSGSKAYTKMPDFALSAKATGDLELSNKITLDYLENYLDSLSETEFLATLKKVKYNFWIGPFFSKISSNDKVFRWLYRNGNQIDKAIKYPHYSHITIDNVITKEEINPRLWPGGNPINRKPNWGKLSSIITSKYGSEYAKRVILTNKIYWYYKENDSALFVKFNIQKIEKYGFDTAGPFGLEAINEFCYSIIFKYSNDKAILNKGIRWMNFLFTKIPGDSADWDTYANLLYKAGRKEEAISAEKKAIRLDKESSEKLKGEPDESLATTLEKMTRGVPTWSDNSF